MRRDLRDSIDGALNFETVSLVLGNRLKKKIAYFSDAREMLTSGDLKLLQLTDLKQLAKTVSVPHYV